MPAEEAALKVQHASTSQTRNFTLLARTGSPSCVAHSRQTPQKYGLCVSQLLDNGYGVYELFNMLGFSDVCATKPNSQCGAALSLLASGVLQYCNHQLSGASQNNASSHGTCLRQTAYCNHKLKPSITKQCFEARYLLYWQAAYCMEHHKTMLSSTVLALLASSVLQP